MPLPHFLKELILIFWAFIQYRDEIARGLKFLALVSHTVRCLT